MTPGLRHLKMVGILDRVGIARRVKLSPEQSDATRMKSLVDALLAQNAPCAVLMLHSSSLIVGTSPYVRTPDDLERLYRRLDEVFTYCCKHCEMNAPTLTRFANDYRDQDAAQSATSQIGVESN